MRDFARLLLNSTSDVCFFPKKYLDAEFSRKKLFLQANCKDKLLWCKIFTHKNIIFWLQGRKHSLPFKIKGLSLTRFRYYIFMDTMVFSVATVKLLLGVIGWNLYLMWSSVNCRHNFRHIRTIPFLLPPDWDGWPLNFTITHFL